jgi:hypothetical protein
MNGRQIRTWAALAASIVLYQGAMAAGKELTPAADARKLYADSMNTDKDGNPLTDTGQAFFTAGIANRDFVVALEEPDQTTCDAYEDFIAQDQTFLQELSARGFTSVGCVRWDGGMKYTTITRAITRRPVQPAPPSTEPRSVPQRHAANVVEASA